MRLNIFKRIQIFCWIFINKKRFELYIYLVSLGMQKYYAHKEALKIKKVK